MWSFKILLIHVQLWAVFYRLVPQWESLQFNTAKNWLEACVNKWRVQNTLYHHIISISIQIYKSGSHDSVLKHLNTEMVPVSPFGVQRKFTLVKKVSIQFTKQAKVYLRFSLWHKLSINKQSDARIKQNGFPPLLLLNVHNRWGTLVL